MKWLRKILRAKAAVGNEFLDERKCSRAFRSLQMAEDLSELVRRSETISARIDFSEIEIEAQLDSHGVALHQPPQRETLAAGLPQVRSARARSNRRRSSPRRLTPGGNSA